jgi:hypothetical protein
LPCNYQFVGLWNKDQVCKQKKLTASVHPQAIESHRAANNLAERANVEHGSKKDGMKLDKLAVTKLVNGCAASGLDSQPLHQHLTQRACALFSSSDAFASWQVHRRRLAPQARLLRDGPREAPENGRWEG